MNEERITKLLGLYNDLEAAAGDTLLLIADWVCDIEDRKATDEVTPYTHRVIQSTHKLHGCLDALDALRADIEAHPAEAQVCSTCKWWTKARCVEWGHCNMVDDWQTRNDSTRQTPAWLSHHDMSKLDTEPSFGCTAWELDPTAGVKPLLVIDYSKPEDV